MGVQHSCPALLLSVPRTNTGRGFHQPVLNLETAVEEDSDCLVLSSNPTHRLMTEKKLNNILSRARGRDLSVPISNYVQVIDVVEAPITMQACHRHCGTWHMLEYQCSSLNQPQHRV